jgi:tetratricopeptide (TPR) repeat protein
VIGGAIEPPSAPEAIERVTITDFKAGAMPLPGLEPAAVEPLTASAEPSPGLDPGVVAAAEPQPQAPSAPEEPAAALEPEPAPPAARRPAAPTGDVNGVADVEALLRQAEQEFRGGDRDAASRTLMRAAQGYEELDKLESAAVIYRSLSKSPNAPGDAALRWFQNCERRGQKGEAAQVACEIGDRVLNDGDAATAVQWFERARSLDPANDHALRRLSRLGAGAEPTAVSEAPAPAPPPAPLPISPPAATRPAAPAPAPPRPVAPASPAPSQGQGKLEVAMGSIDAVAPDLSALLGEFQRGVEALISDDAQSNYDLGMAYREMGLLDQALECFRIAARSPAFVQRCSEMIGRSLLDQGLFDDAIAEFTSALTIPGLDPASAANVRFQLGLAHEAAGRPHEALSEFEQVYAQQANYPDVAQKIKALRRALESV